jgi:hypothetical protein
MKTYDVFRGGEKYAIAANIPAASIGLYIANDIAKWALDNYGHIHYGEDIAKLMKSDSYKVWEVYPEDGAVPTYTIKLNH